LELLDEPLLFYSGVPYLGTICKPRDDERVIDLSPIEEVESADRVTEDVDAPDVGASAVGHDGDVSCPVKAVINIHSEVSEMRYCGNMVGA